MPFDRPRREELVTAVKEFLEQKVLPELSGHLNFNTRVSINVLKILERELTTESNITDAARSRLQKLLHTKESNIRELNQELCESIDNSAFNYTDPALCEHLWQTTLDKISVDNPRYSSYLQEVNTAKIV